MIIFISSLLYTIEVVLQHGNCLNLIDLQQGGAAHSLQWKLASSRAPAMYERVTAHTLPRKREINSNFRKYWYGNKNPHNKIFLKASRRQQQDERDANLKNKLASLVKQAMLGTEDVMKEVESLKQEHRDQESYKAGFVLSMLKKSRDVVNELFNVAIKHRDEWQALEQLKIFEIIVHTNIDTTHLLKQLIDIKNGREVDLDPTTRPTTESTDKIDTVVTEKVTPATENSNIDTSPPTQETSVQTENTFLRLGFQSQY